MSAKNITYELEYSLVGSLLKSELNSTAREILSWLTPEMFATHQLGQIYQAIKAQALRDNLIDILLLNADYGQDLLMLADLMKNTVGSSNLSGYADKVHQLYQRRMAQSVFLNIANELNSTRDDSQLDPIVGKGLNQLNRIMSKSNAVKPWQLGELLPSYLHLVHERSQPAFKERLLYTGIEALDDKLGGINETDICIVAGRAGNGKTETAITLTKNVIEKGGAVLFFSLEMSKEQIMDRLVASASGINSTKLRNPQWLSDEDFGRMGAIVEKLETQQLYIVDKGGLTADEIISISEKHIQDHGKPKMIVIDYIGLIRHGALDGRINRTYQIGETMEKFKTFCKDHHCPILLLAQLNRNADGNRPTNGDLRDSGSLEQDASQIIMVHNQRSKDGEPAPYTEWIVTKNRFGVTGTVYVQFQNGRFIECDQAQAWEFFQPKERTPQQTGGKRYGALA